MVRSHDPRASQGSYRLAGGTTAAGGGGTRQTGECVGCGFEGVVEYHHPDGKHNIMYVYKRTEGGDLTKERLDIEEGSNEWWDILLDVEDKPRGLYIEKEHVNPDNKVALCPLCHYLVHRWSLSIEEAGALVLGYWRARFEDRT